MLLTGTSDIISLTDKDGNTALHLACRNVSFLRGLHLAFFMVWSNATVCFIHRLYTRVNTAYRSEY